MRKAKTLRSLAVLSLCASISFGIGQAQNTKNTTSSVSSPQLSTPQIEKKIDALLKQMTLEEKLGQLVQYNDSGSATPTAAQLALNPDAHSKVDAMELAKTGRLGSMLNTVGAAQTNKFQHAAVEQSRLHIPLLFGADIIHGFRTIYPQPLGLAASFDPDLVSEVSHMSASESTTAGIRWFYSPMVDISRDARWGRTTEGAGEDPYLGAAMARAYVKGYQGKDLSDPESVAAGVKHFAAYGAAEAGREYNTTDMSDIRLRQVYLPPYEAAVKAGAATIMSAFNALNGVPATANPYLLQTILRDEWKFNGLVVSDYTAVMELENHGVALTPAIAARKALLAGVDIDMMSNYYDKYLPELVRSGQVPMSAVNEAVRRVLRVKFALGLFEHPYARGTEITSTVPEHRPLVRRAAEESFVLLQNKDVSGKSPMLPLSKQGHKIALIGPLGDNPAEMMGSWSGGPELKDVITIKAALEVRAKEYGGSVFYAKGTEILGNSEAGFADAVQAAKESDLAVLALGESGAMSGEGGSRSNLDLPGNQQKLLEAVAETGKPIVLLVFSGRPLVLSWAAEHIPAIMEVWFPGTEAGSAIANVLYGDVVPSGKLPMSFPRNVGQEPLYYSQFPTGRPAIGEDLSKGPDFSTRFVSRYIDIPNDALFPFGFGLTYSQFGYGKVSLSRTSLPLQETRDRKAASLVKATATVTNTGRRTATEVVQCYVGNRGASVEQPLRSLKGFQRVTLKPGESKEVSFDLGFAELSFYNEKSQEVVEPTHYTVWIGGSSQATEQAQFNVTP